MNIFKKNKKGELQFSFAWIFAIIAGIFILFLAIFGVSKFINIERTQQDAQTAKDIDVLLNPLESSFETGKKILLSTPVETRIYSECNIDGFFGVQRIRTSQNIYNEWSNTNINIESLNKYIFSNEYVEGKDFYIFSKPFEFPFKVADLIYISSSEDRYCFLNAPENIKKEIRDLKQENLFWENCPEGIINVCFSGGNNCRINVNYNAKSVKKNNQVMYFEDDSLMYAAIFSNKEIYECQLKRLMKRTEQLSILYRDKSSFLSLKIGCEETINSDLSILNNLANKFTDSNDLTAIKLIADNIQIINENEVCRLW